MKNITQTSGVAERFPAWSPNGKQLAYWSDKSGEYQLILKNLESNLEKSLTTFKDGYRYHSYWSPDSKKLVFIDVDEDDTYPLMSVEDIGEKTNE